MNNHHKKQVDTQNHSDQKKESVLDKDFDHVLKKRFSFSVFNLVMLLVILCVTAFFAGTQTAGVFNIFPKAAMFGTGSGGFQIFYPTPAEPTPDPSDADCTDPKPRADCKCQYDGFSQSNKWNCPQATPVATAYPTTQDCQTVPPRAGCNCKYNGSEYVWNCPEPTRIPTPYVDRNCDPSSPPAPLCKCKFINNDYDWQCPEPTQPGGATTVPTQKVGGGTPGTGPTTATQPTTSGGGSCAQGYNLGNCSQSGGGCCTDWGVGPGCSQYDADRHFESCQAKCGYAGNPNACGGGGGGTDDDNDGSQLGDKCDSCSSAAECKPGLGCNGGVCGFRRNCE